VDKDSPIIEMKNVSYGYSGDRAVLQDIHLKIFKGDRVGLVAPNGSGKTTLFHLIMGLIKPTAGEIRIFEKTVREESDFKEVRRRIGLLFQDSDDQLFSPTVLEDVAFGPLNMGHGKREAIRIAEKTLDSLALGAFRDRVTAKLSGGEKRLVALATVLAMEPEVLLLDEPTTGLDTDTRKRITEILRSRDVSYILISHNFDFISALTDTLYTLEDGRLLSEAAIYIHRHAHAHPHGIVPHEHR
jgi:cobalt/nickel transport system ATP-binding protein